MIDKVMQNEDPELAKPELAKSEPERLEDAEAEQAQATPDESVDETDPRVRPFLKQMSESDTPAGNAEVLAQARTDLTAAENAVHDANEALQDAQRNVKAAKDAQHKALSRVTSLTELPLTSVAEHMRPGEETTLMFFPKAVQLRDGSKEGNFPAGINEVPKSLSTHWWLSSQGVRFYRGSLPEPKAPEDNKPQEPETA